MNHRHALILVNKLARKGESDLESVRQALAAGGVASTVYFFDNVSEIPGAVQLHRHTVDRIVVGGGDGTINASLEAILGSDLPLGILPMGTANDLARTLQLPFDPVQAAQVIAAGRLDRVDLGWVNGKHYCNVANIGLAVGVNVALTHDMKKRWGVLAYPLSMINAYRGNRPFRARIICDRIRHDIRSIQMAIGNGRHYGGGMTVRHDAEINDCLLNFYSLEPQPFWRLLLSAPKIAKGTLEPKDPVLLMDGKQIEVATNRPMRIFTDGEWTARTPASFRVVERRLPVFVP